MNPAPSTPPPPAGHEKRDTNLPVVLIAGAALAGLVLITLLLMHWANEYITVREPVRETVPQALLDTRPRPMVGPRVRAQPRQELVGLRASEDARLTGYGRDPLTEAIHVPIEQAMKRVLERGLPVRGNAAATQPAAPNGSVQSEK